MTLTSSVSFATRRPGACLNAWSSTSSRPPERSAIRSNSALIHRLAAPTPRFGSLGSERVWRVPNPASVSTRALIRAAETFGQGRL